MHDEYLWDGSGTPDPEVQRLEVMLRPLGHAAGSPPMLPVMELTPNKWYEGRFSWRQLPGLAAVAALVVVALGLLTFLRPEGVVVGARPQWEVVRVEGTPLVGATKVAERGKMRAGEALQTDSTSRAEINVGEIGVVEVSPNSKVRMVESSAQRSRIALDHGEILARIWAPPRQFQVETAGAVATDLGCIYRVQSDEAGDGVLTVEMGWVAFEVGGREEFVPAGAMVLMRRGQGPGTPFFADASADFAKALKVVDFGEQPEAAAEKERALDSLLSAARPRDAMTLWHLLQELEPAERGRVYDRLATLAPPPSGVTREGILNGDRRMLEMWWDHLGLGDTRWWRIWKGPVPAR